ncbi:Hypothetical predicted protein, partial [Lynx pardinus]
FGGKPILPCSSLIIGLLGTCSVLAPTFQVYCILRFIMAMSLGTILVLEGIPTKAQLKIMTVLSLSMSNGQILLAALAYVFRE